MWVSLLLASVVHIGQFTLFLQTSNETKVIVSSATFYMNWLFFFNEGSKIYRSFISFLIFSFLLPILMLLLRQQKVPDIESTPKKYHCSFLLQFSSLTSVWLFSTLWASACQASLSITNSWSLLRLNVHWIGDGIQPSHPVVPFSSHLQSFPA